MSQIKAGPLPRLLIMGGTGFLGRHFAEEALRRGWRVTLVHLHADKSDLVQGANQILADRDQGLPASLNGKDYDFVVDTSGQKPAWLEESSARLRDCRGYLFISTISVYAHSRQGMDEDSPLAPTEGVKVDTLEPGNYAARKIQCERALRRNLGERVLIFRPCVIAGPYDATDRFTYWADRMRRPGPILGPVSRQETLQWIDARDLAIFGLDSLLGGLSGIYNVAGDSTTFGAFFRSFQEDYEAVWVRQDFLEKSGLEPWRDLPLWVPSSGDNAGFSRVDNRKALEAGLTLRLATRTAADTLSWRDRDKSPLRAGITPRREAEVLAAYGR
ncbi:epimerase [bacterium]|nr:epimerase [bacterium]